MRRAVVHQHAFFGANKKVPSAFYSLVAGFWLTAAMATAAAGPPKLPHPRPEEAGMNPGRLDQIDQAVAEGLQSGCMPGCVVAVGRRGKIVLLRAYGCKQVEPSRIAMTTDTLFDLASLTKPIATAASVMILVEQGKVDVQDPVAKYLPEFAAEGQKNITLLHLLTHQGGLIPDNPLSDYDHGPQRAWRQICALKPSAPPGVKFIYSDIGFIVLGELVLRVSGQNVHEFSHEHLLQPLGMTETGYLPEEPLRRRAAPTEQRDGQWMQGEVHDPRAYRLGGIAGHAGLFSTAEDLAVFAQMMLGEGQYAGVRVLRRQTVAEMTSGYAVPGGLRGLGWDVQTKYSSNRGTAYSPRAFGHGGFTGTALWIDPDRQLFVIFLSNRLHPDGKGNVNPLAGRIGTIAAEAVEDEAAPGTPKGSGVGWGKAGPPRG
jgi:CubicO group peptidase (beta-lactamase class C family)